MSELDKQNINLQIETKLYIHLIQNCIIQDTVKYVLNRNGPTLIIKNLIIIEKLCYLKIHLPDKPQIDKHFIAFI